MSHRQTGVTRGIADLVAILAIAVAGTAVLLGPSLPRAVVWLVAWPFLSIAPGYVVVATVFPRRPSAMRRSDRSSPGWAVRLAMSLLASVLVVGVVGVLLSLQSALSLRSATLAISGVTLLGTLAAVIRRRTVAAEVRADPLGVPSPQVLSARLGFSTSQTFAIAVATFALVGAVAFAAGTPAPSQSYSEAALLDGDDGTILGDAGTITLDRNGTTIGLRLENHEGESRTYGIVGQIQSVGSNGTRETWVVDRTSTTIADGSQVTLQRRIDPPDATGRLRLQYLVYTDSVPENPGPETADLSLRQWITVTDGRSQ
ncbi:MAG: DUF1616 domain-containing protein [Halorhabdus sp.]